jgi:hypothetical protein
MSTTSESKEAADPRVGGPAAGKLGVAGARFAVAEGFAADKQWEAVLRVTERPAPQLADASSVLVRCDDDARAREKESERAAELCHLRNASAGARARARQIDWPLVRICAHVPDRSGSSRALCS